MVRYKLKPLNTTLMVRYKLKPLNYNLNIYITIPIYITTMIVRLQS